MISAGCPTPRLARFTVLAATGAAALSVAACGSSNQSAPTSASTSTSTVTSTTTSQAPAQNQAKVSGLIASVAGNSIQVTKEDNSNAAVNFTATTKITEVSPATLGDVTSGSCVTVRPTKEAQGGQQPVNAASVRVSPSVNGTCPKPKEPGPASGPGSSSPAPSGSPSPAPANAQPVRGSVASVTGNTISVAGTDASGNTTQTAVTVDEKTTYTKLTTATPDAVAQGKCVKARGTMDNAGALQATSITVRAAVDGKCPGKPRG
ncbi:DUF5666 domain-containing protein [Mycobacterium sp. E3198]|uniref:DUF5666 domain-containing protein n=1 Tax=Mycobacterium sp. E3198 TaxID=1834143 RepID=UPI001E2B9AD4|nr:DUF5666 domain-containing protein [Mycobacterium sp. E3198]